MRLPVKILLLIIICYSSLQRADAATSGHSNWYQVELVLFTPRNPQASDEIWPLTSFRYPHNMVSIAPLEQRPGSLEQLLQMMEFEATLSDDTTPDTTTFLFEDAGRQHINRQLLEAASTEVPETPVKEVEPEPAPINAINSDTLTNLLQQNNSVFFQQLSGKNLALGKVANSLRRSSRYDIHLHSAWVQPLDNEGTPILVQTGQHYDDHFEIDGTVKISRNRYLHVDTDLWFTEFTQRPGVTNDLKVDAEISENYPDLVTHARQRGTHVPAQSYRMQQSRRMRSGEMHYLDHPFFGLIVKFTRYTPENQ